jgi:hypothetical protein
VKEKARERERLVAKTDFSMEVVRFTDARRPRSLERGPAEQTIDEYDPDRVLQGTSTRLPAIYEKYLAYKPRTLKHYKLEFDLRELRTEVLYGTFWSGKFGRYAIAYEIEATARRPDSSVILSRRYRVIEDQPRRTYNGYSPSEAMDNTRLMALVDAAVRKTAMDIAWDIRQLDARTWRPEREAAPVPTLRQNLKPQPSLDRATGSVTYGGSGLVVPQPQTEPEPAPDSVPLGPIEY